jgi:hypothetical protein
MISLLSIGPGSRSSKVALCRIRAASLMAGACTGATGGARPGAPASGRGAAVVQPPVGHPGRRRRGGRPRQALIDAGIPLAQVPRFERLVSTFVLGYAISEVAGRFAAGAVNPRGLRAQLQAAELPAHRALLPWLEQPLDHDAEFEADLADLFTLIEVVIAATDGAGHQV